MLRILCCVCFVLVAGCSGSGLDLNLGGDNVVMQKEHAMFIEKAGVVSFVESHPRLQFVGPSLKESTLDRLVLADWNATQTITELLEGRLRQKGYKVVKIDPDMAVSDAYSSSASFAEPERIRERLIEVGRAHGVDMLVVVYRQQVRDFVAKSSQKVISYGLYKRNREPDVYAYAVVHVEALNIAKGYVLGKADGEVKMKLDGSAWQPEFESGEGPFPLNAPAARERIIAALTDSTLIAAQEAGISN